MSTIILSIPWQPLLGIVALVLCLFAGVAVEAFMSDDIPTERN